jgi:hypothetical protein
LLRDWYPQRSPASIKDADSHKRPEVPVSSTTCVVSTTARIRACETLWFQKLKNTMKEETQYTGCCRHPSDFLLKGDNSTYLFEARSLSSVPTSKKT